MAGMQGGAGKAKLAAPLARRRALSASRLASALGLTPLVRSLRGPAGQQNGVHASHADLLATARRKIGGKWYTASSAQHAKPMLQVRCSCNIACAKPPVWMLSTCCTVMCLFLVCLGVPCHVRNDLRSLSVTINALN
jgi:hypothetical protein